MGKREFLNEEQCRQLLCRFGASEAVIDHGAAVAQCALELAKRSGGSPDLGLLKSACLLHDIARGQPRHEAVGTELLEQAGYPAVAALIAVHHDLPEDCGEEAELLYLADKLVRGAQRVTLEERFAASWEKCVTPQARAAWQRRYDRARRILEGYKEERP